MAGLTTRTEEAPPGQITAAPVETGGRARLWAASTFDAFRFPTYRTVWLGSVLAFLAFNTANVAQGIVAYDLTGENRAVGLVQFGQGVAMTFLNPFGGAIADRFSRRLLILVAHSVIGAVILAQAILIATGQINIALLAIGSFTIGSMFSFLGPTRTALIGDTVAEDRIGNAMALLQVGGNFARISAPPLAGFLMAWSVFGATGTYFLVSAIFIAVLGTLYQIPATPRRPATGASVIDDIRGGVRYVLRRPRLLHAVVSFHLVLLLGFSYIVIMPGYAKDTLDAGNAGLGILLGVSAAGGLLASLLVASLADSPRAQVYLTLSSLIAGASLILAGLAPSFAVAVVVMGFAGCGASAFQTLNNSFAMRLTGPDFYGRVIGLMFLAWGLINLMSLPIGYLADEFGERAVLSGLGAGLCASVALMAIWGASIGRQPDELARGEAATA